MGTKSSKKLYAQVLFFIVLALSDLTNQVYAKERFEWGLGALTMQGHHYRGSDQSKTYFFPIPYFVYTSDKIEAEPSFIRGTFYENSWFAFKLSVIVGLNVESEENDARQGMPSLDYTFEAGPMAIFKLWKSQDRKRSLTFEIPFRHSFVTDLTYVDENGFFSIPYLNFIQAQTEKLLGWGYEASIAYMWGSSKFHNFYYGVNPIYATENRPTYDAKAGYSGTQLTVVLKKRWKDLVLIPFIRWDYLKGTAFEDSPLVKQKSYLLGGLGIFWLFGGDKE